MVVIDVQPDSPAWKAGLRSGAFISHIGARRVRTPEDFYTAAAAYGDRKAKLFLASQFRRLPPVVVGP